MRMTRTAIAVAIGALISGAAVAQGTAATVQRDVNQQQRIEQGLQGGQLNTREAAKLEKEQTKVETMQKNAMKDGTMTPAEQARISKAQDATSADIRRQKQDAQVGNPNSASSKRMQADVQRNINQQPRIEKGVLRPAHEHGNRDAGAWPGERHGEAKRPPVPTGTWGRRASGHPAGENDQSARIHDKKHNAVAPP